MSRERLDAALDYRELGFNPVAAPNMGKSPLEAWKRFQTERVSERGVREMFGGATRNIFLITGAVSRLAVLDCDDEASVRHWRERLGPVLNETACVRTGEGCHYYFRLPVGVVAKGRSSSDPTCKWDLRAEGGGVIAPPSVHQSGRTYRWVESRGLEAIADAPEELLSGAPSSASDTAPGRPTLDELLEHPASEGSRNVWLTKVAGHYAREHRGDRVTYMSLVRGAAEKLEPALPDREVAKLAESIWETEHKDKDRGDHEKRKAATVLIDLAESTHEFVRSEEGVTFAIPSSGPRLARQLRGSKSFRAKLAAAYHARYDQAASGQALTDAILTLEARAFERPRQRIDLRVAGSAEGEVVIDLGDASGRAVVVGSRGWGIAPEAPALFRRTELTDAMPEPVRGGSLQGMRSLLNLTDEDWDLLVGYMVSAWIPDIPHPILLVTGEQGSAKTSLQRTIASLLDPSPAGVRSMPRNQQEWWVASGASWGLALDNASWIPGWLSDELCQAATGSAAVRRALYTDDDLVVTTLRGVVMLNSIGLSGSMRGDLGHRLVPIQMERIEGYRSERKLRAEWGRVLPAAFGALLDLLAGVLERWSRTEEDPGLRMTDFARVLKAVDTIRGTDAVGIYRRRLESISEQVVEGDLVASAVRRFLESRAEGATSDRGPSGPEEPEEPEEWLGTATELLAELEVLVPEERRRRRGSWPTNPQQLSVHLRRTMSDLRALGVEVTEPQGSHQRKEWRLRLTDGTL